MKRSYTHWDAKMVSLLRRLMSLDIPQERMAQIVGCSNDTLRKAIRKYATARKPVKRESSEHIARMLELSGRMAA